MDLKIVNIAPHPELHNYQFVTTFWDDFTIADCFGTQAVRETFSSVFAAFRDDCAMLTELVLVLNWKCWQRYELGELKASKMYQTFYERAYKYAEKHLSDVDLKYFYRILD